MPFRALSRRPISSSPFCPSAPLVCPLSQNPSPSVAPEVGKISDMGGKCQTEKVVYFMSGLKSIRKTPQNTTQIKSCVDLIVQ